MPTIEVIRDFSGYFERLVREWTKRKCTFKHHTIRITAGPYHFSAVSCESKNGVLTLDFYSGLCAGFGFLSSSDVDAIVEIL